MQCRTQTKVQRCDVRDNLFVPNRKGISRTSSPLQQLPAGCIVDGEVVIWKDNRLDFDALQRRMVTAKTVLPALVHTLPASFAAFDVLAVAGQDARNLPFASRPALLEELARERTAPLNLSPGTTDPEVAKTWFEELPATGVEGLVVKGLSQNYAAETRAWLKIKHRENTDVVCGAVIGPIKQPQAIIAGLPMDGRLRIVGRPAVLTSAKASELARHMQPAKPGHPWPEDIYEASLNRFSKDKGTVHLTLVEPIVVEISVDVAWSGRAYRHSFRLMRVRPELDPAEVELPVQYR